MNALAVTPIPITSTPNPTQSEGPQRARQRAVRSIDQARKHAANAKSATRATSSSRTRKPPKEATKAAVIHHRLRSTSARRTRKNVNVAYGYASGSSTIIGAYATAGIAAEAAATNRAGHLPTIIRAIPYAGKTVKVIRITPT